MKKTKPNKTIKNKIKIVFIGVLMLAAAVLISAGDIIFKAGSLDVSQDLAVSNKLGIGTTAPTGKLEIKNTLGSPTIFDFTGDNRNYIRGVTYFDSGNIVYVAGNVGIGTTGPTWPLDVKASGNWGLRVGTAGASQVKISDSAIGQSPNDGGAYAYLIVASGNSYFNGGNVGIGTTSPTEELHVDGNVKAKQFITGDITFNKDDKPVWRMFEDEDGLYVESLVTGKVYSVVLKEIGK